MLNICLPYRRMVGKRKCLLELERAGRCKRDETQKLQHAPPSRAFTCRPRSYLRQSKYLTQATAPATSTHIPPPAPLQGPRVDFGRRHGTKVGGCVRLNCSFIFSRTRDHTTRLRPPAATTTTTATTTSIHRHSHRERSRVTACRIAHTDTDSNTAPRHG